MLTTFSDVADRLPQAIVHGIDLFPPQVKWMPPNCILEVDNAAADWTWTYKMDFIHLRCVYATSGTELVADKRPQVDDRKFHHRGMEARIWSGI